MTKPRIDVELGKHVTVSITGAHARSIPTIGGIADGTVTKVGHKYFYVAVSGKHELRFDKDTQGFAPTTPSSSDASLWNSRTEYHDYHEKIKKRSGLAHFLEVEPKAQDVTLETLDRIYDLVKQDVGQPYGIRLDIGRTVYLQPADGRTKRDFPDDKYEGSITEITETTFTVRLPDGTEHMFAQRTLTCLDPSNYEFWFYPSNFAYERFHY